MALLRLKSDMDEITLASGNYQLEDDTLEIEDPDVEDVRSVNAIYPGRDLRYMAHKSRMITFQLKVMGASDSAVVANASRIARIIAATTETTYINGGTYREEQAFSEANEGADTGDQGIILKISMESATQTVNPEVASSDLTPTVIYTTRIISGRIITVDSPFKTVRLDGNGNYFRMYKIELECEPFFLRRSRIIAEADDLSNAPVSPDNSAINRLIISAASIPGDVPALTRITTEIDGGQGVVIARDAGISILNCPAFPVYTKASGGDPDRNDMFCYGQVQSSTGAMFNVKISAEGTPDSFQWKKNSGSYSSSIQIEANTPVKLGSDDVYVYFWTETGHNINDEWNFRSNQAYIVIDDNTDLYPQRDDVYSDNGFFFASGKIVIPPGCKSKYRVYASFNPGALPSVGLEFMMTAFYLGFVSPSGGRVSTVANQYDWVRLPPGASYIDLGVLDFTPDSSPFLLHPQVSSEMDLQFSVRSDNELANPSNLTIRGVYLVPCQDEYACMHVVWKFDGFGREVFCNYDPAHPYVAEVSANYFDEPFEIANAVPLDATYSGNIITLIPGVINTLLFIPVFSTNTSDWRIGTFTTNSLTGEIYVAIRPRYLYI